MEGKNKILRSKNRCTITEEAPDVDESYYFTWKDASDAMQEYSDLMNGRLIKENELLNSRLIKAAEDNDQDNKTNKGIISKLKAEISFLQKELDMFAHLGGQMKNQMTNGSCINKCDAYPKCKPCGEMETEQEFKSAIQWTDSDKFYGLDYSTRLGKYKDFTFDIRYDYCGDSKVKPEKCGMTLCIYYKGAKIEDRLGNLKGLTNYSERYIQNEISNRKSTNN